MGGARFPTRAGQGRRPLHRGATCTMTGLPSDSEAANGVLWPSRGQAIRWQGGELQGGEPVSDQGLRIPATNAATSGSRSLKNTLIASVKQNTVRATRTFSLADTGSPRRGYSGPRSCHYLPSPLKRRTPVRTPKSVRETCTPRRLSGEEWDSPSHVSVAESPTGGRGSQNGTRIAGRTKRMAGSALQGFAEMTFRPNGVLTRAGQKHGIATREGDLRTKSQAPPLCK